MFNVNFLVLIYPEGITQYRLMGNFSIKSFLHALFST